ncbi:MBL fold metallo-hydrolase [Streptomyces diastatochromogenes]|uniref:Metallo-beta-lactamase domain-containing protein n=1 Tax=Streptomyces diastatochromogenes TaxID=42236 RepID=A0A233S9C2_STRDA|nr:MBL fold metallo-hydrolase [Streptomyces diastatochromogenes]MCZ0991050.1 MBL fold metallo-hydrolase [Streptomyces diastatochromogenes]OXY92290.1 hypothetical protein BEK98_26230 [Streptomyces diastatochromogenes]
MKIHHLNCGSMAMPTAPMVTHVFLLETDNGLVLVDAGYGMDDIADPAERVGFMRWLIKPAFSKDETALRQVERLGFKATDVRHIVVTHFDFDHIGGIADFPQARIHTTSAEVLGAITSPTRAERRRYRPAQWAHGPHIVEHRPDGEPWRGFAAAKELTDIAPGIVLVSLPGHTRGHACIAVDRGDKWLLHCGDAFYHRGVLDGTPIPPLLTGMERMAAMDWARVKDNHRRLAELHQRADTDLQIVSAHDPLHFDALAAAAPERPLS